MAFRKHTTLQLSGDARVADTRVVASPVTAKLSDFQFNPEEGFLYVTTRAISSRVNANYDGWPPEELRNAYRTFIGRPVYVDHNNWDLKRSRGVIIDSKLYESKLASGHEDVWVQLLIEVDAQAFPKLAQSIVDGDIDAVSMGADVEYTVCSVCANKAHDVLQYCAHIPGMKGREVQTLDSKTGSTIKKLCYEDCYGVSFFEISFVFDPADESALISDVMLAGKADNRALAHIIQPRETIAAYSERLGTSLSKVSSITADKTLMSLPQEVDTLRDELNCPQCGAEWNGMVCLGCGFELPPEGLDDPQVDPTAGMQMPGADEIGQGEDEGDQPNDDSKDDSSKDDSSKDDSSSNKKKDDSKKDDSKKDKSKDDKSKSKKKSGTKEEPSVSRFADLQKQALLPQDPPYRQDTYPGTSAEPYGVVTPEGNQPEGLEPALELAPAAVTDVRALDAPDVAGPIGQSEVDVVSQPEGPTDVPPPGSQAAEALGAGVAASKDNARSEFYRARAAAMRERADEFEKKAETITQTDVRALDEPPAVNVGPDATMDVLKPIQEAEQLALADTPDAINDGSETGVPAVADRLNQQVNPFNDVALRPYGASVKEAAEEEEDDDDDDSTKEAKIAVEAAEAKAREDQRVAAAKTRVLRVANFVDERIEMGLTRPDDKYSDVAKFEAMDDATLDGYVQATREFKAKEIKTASKRVRVAASKQQGPTRMPSLGSVSHPVVDSEDPADDYVAFL